MWTDSMNNQEQMQKDDLLQSLTEFPVMGTSLNPLQESWASSEVLSALTDQAGSTD
ncbi:hypothetical protein P4V43_09080 [Brevibacillus fortis]|uniref:hypothetical protein n=1 Tax=Brevibacillus fortis TaxID=2126352 RepID=UPI001304ACF9|nr:hypothetical protein [Brevibacillus fortis]MED1781969.1 hypothetical protein [Brevibacillus fortis]